MYLRTSHTTHGQVDEQRTQQLVPKTNHICIYDTVLEIDAGPTPLFKRVNSDAYSRAEKLMTAVRSSVHTCTNSARRYNGGVAKYFKEHTT